MTVAEALRSRLARSPAAALLLGAVTVAGFQPFALFPLPLLTLALLLGQWQRAPSARRRIALGFAFGLGLFLAGVSWVYVSLHDFGAMPWPLAAFTTLLLCAYLALYPAVAGWAFGALPASFAVRACLILPGCWTILEWSRGWLFTGFPWLALGYSQIPASPLAGFAPLLGIHGVTFATVACAGSLAAIFHGGLAGRRRAAALAGGTLVLLLVAGWVLKQARWTVPTGEPVTVALLQGNIPQDLKWRPERLKTTLDTYLDRVSNTDARLIVLPETALPLFLKDVPPAYLLELTEHARRNGGDVLVGLPETHASQPGVYFNSVLSFGASPSQVYRKRHLVPFGEFVPLKAWLGEVVAALAIPLTDFSRGAPDQPPLQVAGQRVGVNICYEDAFGDEIIRQLPAATLLVNVSNVAWFGRSIAPWQHLQISQARALETGRAVLRATNTGMTAAIAADGTVVGMAVPFTGAVLRQTVQGFSGATPYVRWGDVPALGWAVAAVVLGIARRRRDGAGPPAASSRPSA